MTNTDAHSSIVSLTADIVAAYVSANKIGSGDVPALITSVHNALAETAAPTVPNTAPQEPAVSIRSSIKQDYIVCLEDGAKLKLLKRYLRTRYNMTPGDYRTKWDLPHDYPMVAPAYAEKRRGLANAIGLGRKKTVDADNTTPATNKEANVKANSVDAPKKRGRPAKVAAPVEATPLEAASNSGEA